VDVYLLIYMAWVQALGYAISAFSGGVSALVLTEVLKYKRSPRLSMELDFSALKVKLIDNAIQHEIRLNVYNKGKSPAEYCEAKIELQNEHGESLSDPLILHWVRNYLEPQNETEQYKPITINSNDHEFLAMIVLKTVFSTTSPKEVITLKTDSNPPYRFLTLIRDPDWLNGLLPDVASGEAKYKFVVTVFSKNHKPISEKFSLFWNGNMKDFNHDSVKKLPSQARQLTGVSIEVQETLLPNDSKVDKDDLHKRKAYAIAAKKEGWVTVDTKLTQNTPPRPLCLGVRDVWFVLIFVFGTLWL
jgi:hypothetical protein